MDANTTAIIITTVAIFVLGIWNTSQRAEIKELKDSNKLLWQKFTDLRAELSGLTAKVDGVGETVRDIKRMLENR